MASAVRNGTADIHSAWTPISQSYEGPGDQELYDAMTPIVPQGTAFGDDLDKVAKALDDFVTEVTPIVAKLKTYVTRGNQLHADVKAHDGAWDEDETLNGENNDIINGVANQVVAYQAAERTCANTIRALDCLAPLHAMSGDGSDDPLGYGYKELPMGTKLPWGTAEARKESCGEKTLYFVPNLLKGVVVDGIWGTVQGLGQLVGIDGTGWHLDTLTNSWKGMGSLIGYSAADNSWSWATRATPGRGSARRPSAGTSGRRTPARLRARRSGVSAHCSSPSPARSARWARSARSARSPAPSARPARCSTWSMLVPGRPRA
ncbi:hypothetical protein P9139_17755 [Curtobacterium flaccumfaciens]|nr:hypothetical protein P9139_17755 [Curtobacterium flaccumfaciens]